MIAPPHDSLDRRLGPLDASAIVISNVIGVGIFTTPGTLPAYVAFINAERERLGRIARAANMQAD